jgi:hypothetical protein
MRFSILLALSLTVAACGGDGADQTQDDHDPDHDADRAHPEMRAAEGSEGADVANATAEGVVRVVGNDPTPQVVLSVGDGAEATQIALVGEFHDELGMLSGVEVSVAGSDVPNPQGFPEQAIDVYEYDVLSVNSVPAYLGVLELRDGELWLDRENALQLTSVPAQLANMEGAKVWITGPVDGEDLRVQSFGIVKGR